MNFLKRVLWILVLCGGELHSLTHKQIFNNLCFIDKIQRHLQQRILNLHEQRKSMYFVLHGRRRVYFYVNWLLSLIFTFKRTSSEKFPLKVSISISSSFSLTSYCQEIIKIQNTESENPWNPKILFIIQSLNWISHWP